MTRRVLMVSPHFPPDTSAATHRVRLLLPHLAALGWTPTVLTLTPESYEGTLEPALGSLVSEDVRVERVAALPAALTRAFGFGDLGLRSWMALRSRVRELMRAETFDALFWTVYPTWPAQSGPSLAHEAGAAFVLDLQDPWVGAWGDTVGPAGGGRPDMRSRMSRALSVRAEEATVLAADGVTAVSAGTIDALAARVRAVRDRPTAEVPLVALAADVAWARSGPPLPDALRFDDDHVHVVWVGTLLPAGLGVLRAILDALADAGRRDARVRERVRLHFVGTSNESRADAPARALPVAREAGVAAQVTEHAPRVGYREALQLLGAADAVLLGGSTEAHYTPSRLYPALLGGAPMLAVYREGSHAVSVLRGLPSEPAVHVVAFPAGGPDHVAREALARAWRAVAALPSGAGAARAAAPASDARTLPVARAAAAELVRVLDAAVARVNARTSGDANSSASEAR
jgi:hypothetical protein